MMSSKAWHIVAKPILQRQSQTAGFAFVAILVAVLLGWWGGNVWLGRQAANDAPAAVAVPNGVPVIGQPAPDFMLPVLHGEPQSLSAWRGHPVIINFWASWCGPCRREMPILIDAAARYQAQGLVILAVNLTYQDTLDNAAAFANEFQIPFPVLLDTTGAVAETLYGARGVPMSFVIDRDGVLRYIYLGAVDEDWLNQVMSTLAE